MQQVIASELTRDLLSSARVFAWSVREVVERQILRELVGEELTFSQLKLLYFVAHTDVHTIGDAAAFLGVSKAAASKAVDKLVRRRLLRRAEVQANRRATQLSLTEASRRILGEYEAARDGWAAEVFGQFPAEELSRTSEVLARLAAAITSRGARQDEVCLRCEIYFRERCRFGELGRRSCFYQDHKRDQRERPSGAPANGGEEREV